MASHPGLSGLCTEDDDFVREIPRWVAELSDGLSVYQDDERPGVDPPQAWLRLRRHCLEAGAAIERLRLQFRSNVIWLPPSAEGYYFARMAFGEWGGHSFDGVLIGPIEGGVARLGKFKLPELAAIGRVDRAVDADDPCVIARGGGWS